jgi:hypothetical protein
MITPELCKAHCRRAELTKDKQLDQYDNKFHSLLKEEFKNLFPDEAGKDWKAVFDRMRVHLENKCCRLKLKKCHWASLPSLGKPNVNYYGSA